MRARLFPLGNDSLMHHELVRMGHEAPVHLLRQPPATCKFIDVPHRTAARLTQYLRQRAPQCWWYDAPGATAATVDLLTRAGLGADPRTCSTPGRSSACWIICDSAGAKPAVA